ncbi:MAG: hypothetical protein EB059_10835 [Alphaproteobacteria bacterium]|nr:hypothetical protein [Alphaproteobacteria bacterium]
MSLLVLIESVPGWNDKTPEEIYDFLAAPTVEISDPAFWTWAGIEKFGGADCAQELCAFLKANGKEHMIYQLGGKGLVISDNDVQQMLYYLHSIGKPGMLTLALMGKRTISALEASGISTSIEEISLVQRKRMLEYDATNRLQAYREALSSWNGSGEEPVL